jgi:TRAP-type mannitol/chloroaromatic compound transport system permease small subunit
MKLISYYIQLVDAMNEKMGHFVSWLSTLMILIVCFDVFTRYVLKRSSPAVQELEWHLFAIIFLLSVAYTLKHDRHLRVDVLYAKVSKRSRAVINLLGSILFLIPFVTIGIF